MLENASKFTVGLEADFGAVFEFGFDFDFGIAGDFAIDFWHREATFVIGDEFAVAFDDFWVDESGEIRVVFVFKIVANDDDAAIDAHLRGGHGGRKLVRVLFFPIERKFAHVGDDFLNFIINYANFGGFLAKSRIGSGDDFFHSVIIS